MKKILFQILILVLLAAIFGSGYLIIRHVLNLPFRATNDALHQKKSALTLDFLIPGGTYIDEKKTIGEAIQLRFKKEKTFYEKIFTALSDMIPAGYRYIADILFFVFWSLLFMTFFRIFTFMRYGRALRGSLFLGGITYYYMPDFTPGKMDDMIFVGIPVLIILLRMAIRRGQKARRNKPSTSKRTA